MSREKPQEADRDKHPQDYMRDLGTDPLAGQNIGTPAAASARTAYDIKDLHRRLSHLLDDDLKQVVVQPEGARLKQGATYVDLNDLERGEFAAAGDMTAGPGNYYVAKDDVHYNLWNLLIGVREPDEGVARGKPSQACRAHQSGRVTQ